MLNTNCHSTSEFQLNEGQRPNYKMTAEGYRSVPGQKLSDNNKNILLVGCSLTFGIGVDDNQTISYFLKKSFNKHNIINLGFPSGGLNDLIDDVLQRERYKRINANGGSVIYTFIPHHIERTLCKFDCYRGEEWILRKNNYTWDHDGNPINLGTFKDSRSKIHNFIYNILAQSETLNYISFQSNQIPDSSDQLIFFRYLKFLSLEYKKKNLDFYFFTLQPETLSQEFYENLNESGIHNISYSISNLPPEIRNKIEIPGDGHYTEVGNYLIAKLISYNLKNNNFL